MWSMRLAPRLALAAALALGSGCYVQAATTVPTSAEVSVGDYVPAYYDGYPVYYDGVGNPYYYSGGVAVWISPYSPYYPGLVHHWHAYGPAYGRWYGAEGYRYRGYRAAPGYYGYGHPHGGGGAYHGGGGHGGGHH
jgi:hypothetical protein